jgi:Zn finger protein HypA/HybF involved in hydrogenase expression
MAMLSYDEYYDLSAKYRRMPRKGWLIKGSRKKSNETIEVGRQEVCAALDDAAAVRLGFDSMMKTTILCEGLLSNIAKEHDDAIRCPHCISYYRASWHNGKCPYCDALSSTPDKE